MPLRPALFAALALSAGAVALPLAGCQSAGSIAADAPLPSTIQTISARADAAGKPALVVVGAEWCGACKAYEARTLDVAATRSAIDQVAYYEKVDFDQHKDDVRAMGVTTLPTTVLIVDGAPVASFTGAKNADDLLAWIDANDG